MHHTTNLMLFLTEAVVYFAAMTGLLHFRHRLGLGLFLTALGVMHFLETYLAAVFYVPMPFGTVSPGSSVLFSGKLMLILLLYMREDAETVRQPIYGLFFGNLLTVLMAFLLQFHETIELSPGQSGDTAFLREMGWLMLWGTTLLYLDSIGIILLYERLGHIMQRFVTLRYFISGAVVLTFDQIGFFFVLYVFLDVPGEVFWGGWQAKMLSAAVYSLLFLAYQSMLRTREPNSASRPIADVFSDLTFRERYEDLLARTGHDMLTGVFDRNRMEIEAPTLVRECLRKGHVASVIILDVDHFKSVNDLFGHMQGDEVLKSLALTLQDSTRADDRLFRFGGEEFIVVLPRTDHADTMHLAERLRRKVAAHLVTPDGLPVTISVGVASAPEDGVNFSELLASADRRLYLAKRDGRNCVRGREAE